MSLLQLTGGAHQVWVAPSASFVTANRRDATYVGSPRLGVAGAIADDPKTSVGFEGVVGQYAGWNPTSRLAGPYTVEGWVKAHGAQVVWPAVFGTRHPGDYSFQMSLSNGHILDVNVGDGQQWLAFGGVSLPLRFRVWWYLAAVVTTNGLNLFANGRPVGFFRFSGTPLLFDPSHGVLIGASGEVGQNIRGQVDEVAVYSYALTAEQIAAHYAAGVSP